MEHFIYMHTIQWKVKINEIHLSFLSNFRYFKLGKKLFKYKKYNINHKKEAKKLLYLCTRGSSHYKQTFLYNNICKNKNMIHKYLTMYFKHKLW